MKVTSLIAVIFAGVFSTNGKLPDAGLTTPELVSYWGYPVETYRVQTDDGYILTLHRVPHGKKEAPPSPKFTVKKKPVFFLQHGALGSSASFFLNLPHQSLGYLLADAGFDVWLGNTRGNRYSKRHINLKPSDKKFWQFSFDEMAKYDLPTMIHFVLYYTHHHDLNFLGYSQGNTIAFAALSENKYLNEKIKIHFALGPVTRLKYANNALVTMSSYDAQIKSFFDLFEVTELVPTSKAWNIVSDVMCTNVPYICDILYGIMAGIDMTKNYNATRLPLYATYIPAGTSAMNILHYMQTINSKVFRKYDYRPHVNDVNVGVPEMYDITKITTPTVLISSDGDIVSTPKDVKWTASQLPNVVSRIELSEFNHLELVWAPKMKPIYEKIISMTQKL